MFKRVETVYYSHYGGETLYALITAPCIRNISIVCSTLCPGAIYLWNNSTSSAQWDSTCSVVALNKFSITWKIRNRLKKVCSFQTTKHLIINPYDHTGVIRTFSASRDHLTKFKSAFALCLELSQRRKWTLQHKSNTTVNISTLMFILYFWHLNTDEY